MNHFQFRCGMAIIVISTLACNLSVAGGTPVPLGQSNADATVSAVSQTQTQTDTPSPSPEPAATLPPPTSTPTVPPPAALPTDTPIPSATSTQPPNIPDWPLFRNGDHGYEVYAIQALLDFHGQNLDVDGIFGPQTRTAVVNFQNQKGLSADGIVGPKTWSALIIGAQVQYGSSGSAVIAAQHLLKNKFGYSLGLDDIGSFGPDSPSALTAFQTDYGLLVDGIVGPQTWKALVAIQP